MAFFTSDKSVVKGLAACVPEKIYSNRDYRWIGKARRESFIASTGIAYRHVSPPGQTASDLCVEAASQLLDKLQWRREDISILVFVSVSSDYQAPATASVLQHRLGLSHSCMCFDINLACSGYVYALSVVSALISAHMPKALLLAGDTGSVYTSYRDKSTFPLFGDAGTATAIEYTPDAPLAFFDMNTDGSGFEALYVPDGGARHPFSKKTLTQQKYGEGIFRNRNQIFLDGVAILKFSLREVPPHIKSFLKRIDRHIDNTDYFFLHQANKLINAGIGKMLGLDASKMPETLHHYGNTISASIPLTMADALCNKPLNDTMNVLLCGFGAGLSWGSAYICLQQPIILPVIVKPAKTT